MTMEPFEQVLKGCDMERIGVILLEQLSGQEKEVDEHGIGDEFCDLEEGLVLYFDCGDPSNDLENDNHDGRP